MSFSVVILALCLRDKSNSMIIMAMTTFKTTIPLYYIECVTIQVCISLGGNYEETNTEKRSLIPTTKCIYSF